MLTPIVLNGYVQWVHPWRAAQGQSVYLYGEDYNSPYCPIQFEVRNEKCI